MNAIVKQWVKPIGILTAFFLVAWFLPGEPLDPWGLFNLKRAAYMVFALAAIEVIGSVMIRLLGHRKGAIMTGFFGGLISSTATTVALARESQGATREEAGRQALTFLAATLAMLFEGAALLLLGTSEVHASIFIVFLGPIVAAVLMIVALHRKLPHRAVTADNPDIEIVRVLKVAAFIVAILAVSRLLQNVFGTSGLLVLTFLVSLFEVHGSIIANIQLHDAGAFGAQFLGGLLAVSVLASYVSKLFLVYTIGSIPLRARVTRYTAILFVALLVSWLIFQFAIG